MIIKAIKKLIEFLLKLIGQKTAEIPKAKTPKKSKPFKQVEHSHQQTTFTPFLEKTPEPVTEVPTVITVGSSEIPYLPPGTVIDACAFMKMEDFPEIKEYVTSMINKLQNSPIYVLDTINVEYRRKKCPKNYGEMIRSSSLHPNKYTGKPRNFNRTLADWFESLGATIYFVEAEKSSKVRKSAKKCLTELKKFDLHKPDHMYLGFARITKSVVMTLDCKMIRSSKKGKVKTIDFQEFLDEVMYPVPSPMTRLQEDRQYHNKIHAKTVELYGNHNSFNSRRKR